MRWIKLLTAAGTIAAAFGQTAAGPVPEPIGALLGVAQVPKDTSSFAFKRFIVLARLPLHLLGGLMPNDFLDRNLSDEQCLLEMYSSGEPLFVRLALELRLTWFMARLLRSGNNDELRLLQQHVARSGLWTVFERQTAQVRRCLVLRALRQVEWLEKAMLDDLHEFQLTINESDPNVVRLVRGSETEFFLDEPGTTIPAGETEPEYRIPELPTNRRPAVSRETLRIFPGTKADVLDNEEDLPEYVHQVVEKLMRDDTTKTVLKDLALLNFNLSDDWASLPEALDPAYNDTADDVFDPSFRRRLARRSQMPPRVRIGSSSRGRPRDPARLPGLASDSDSDSVSDDEGEMIPRVPSLFDVFARLTIVSDDEEVASPGRSVGEPTAEVDDLKPSTPRQPDEQRPSHIFGALDRSSRVVSLRVATNSDAAPDSNGNLRSDSPPPELEDATGARAAIRRRLSPRDSPPSPPNLAEQAQEPLPMDPAIGESEPMTPAAAPQARGREPQTSSISTGVQTQPRPANLVGVVRPPLSDAPAPLLAPAGRSGSRLTILTPRPALEEFAASDPAAVAVAASSSPDIARETPGSDSDSPHTPQDQMIRPLLEPPPRPTARPIPLDTPYPPPEQAPPGATLGTAPRRPFNPHRAVTPAEVAAAFARHRQATAQGHRPERDEMNELLQQQLLYEQERDLQREELRQALAQDVGHSPAPVPVARELFPNGAASAVASPPVPAPSNRRRPRAGSSSTSSRQSAGSSASHAASQPTPQPVEPRSEGQAPAEALASDFAQLSFAGAEVPFSSGSTLEATERPPLETAERPPSETTERPPSQTTAQPQRPTPTSTRQQSPTATPRATARPRGRGRARATASRATVSRATPRRGTQARETRLPSAHAVLMYEIMRQMHIPVDSLPPQQLARLSPHVTEFLTSVGNAPRRDVRARMFDPDEDKDNAGPSPTAAPPTRETATPPTRDTATPQTRDTAPVRSSPLSEASSATSESPAAAAPGQDRESSSTRHQARPHRRGVRGSARTASEATAAIGAPPPPEAAETAPAPAVLAVPRAPAESRVARFAEIVLVVVLVATLLLVVIAAYPAFKVGALLRARSSQAPASSAPQAPASSSPAPLSSQAPSSAVGPFSTAV